MTYLLDDAVKQPLEAFRSFDADTQLALLWYGYLDIKEQLTPAPTNSTEEMGQTIFDHFAALSKDDQLQAMRDLTNKTDTSISRGYAALSPSAKLDVWLKLAQGMENGSIVGFPNDYQLPSSTDEFTRMIKGLDFEQRINFTRNAIADMGFKG
ncbi:MAG: orange carotenoid protein N-terminal domain-containing protein [Synechococcales bacterium]|nr:orange carotenoid protein N-terminal domain-containing protein [Synechococcales bacterium]